MAWNLANFVSTDNPTSFLRVDSTLLLTFVLTTLVGVWVSTKLKEWYKGREKLLYLASKFSGPPTLPLIGNALQFACKQEDFLDRIKEVASKYESPMRFWLGPKLFIAIYEPQDFEVLLNSQKASYKDNVYRFMQPFIGKGLISGSGPVHRANRKVIMPMLNSKALNEYFDHFDYHARVCADILDEKVDSGEFDVHPYLTYLSIDLIFDTILGLPGSSQKNGHRELAYWVEAMYELIYERMMKVWLHPDFFFSLTDLAKRQKEGRKVIHGFIESAVKRKKKEHYALERGAITSDKPRLMLLEQLIDHVAKTNMLTDDEIRDQTFTVFTAAQDTTAVVSSFVMLMLGIHQDIQDKVRQEIKDVLGDEDLKLDHLPDLKYIEMVIKEVLRMFPIAPLLVRQTTGEIELESCTIPNGCSIVMIPLMTHYSKKFWKDPEKFIPERFLPENSVGRHQYAYIPFSGGLRGCIGQKFAMMCLKTITVHMIRRFKLTSTQKLETLRLKTDISVRSKDGYNVTLTRA